MTHLLQLRILVVLAIAFSIVGWSSPVQAVSCTINGHVKIQSKDQYYCDTTVLDDSACDGWREVDLDTVSQPMQYMWLYVSSPYSTTKYTSTDQYGNWTVTLQGLPNCTDNGVVTVTYTFGRVHEADVGLASPQWRFWVTGITSNQPDNLAASTQTIDLNGNPTAWTKTFYRSSTGIDTRRANVYYTVNSAMTEIKDWSTNLDTGFTTSQFLATPMRVGLDTDGPASGGATAGFGFIVAYDAYRLGALIRHEFGHVVHILIHGSQKSSQCESENFNYNLGGINHSCEYGAFSTKEAIPTFIAVRSITTNSNNAFLCKCLIPEPVSATDAERCSSLADSISDPDGDGLTDCNGDDDPGPPDNFFGVSDNWSSSPSDCVQLRNDQGCDCASSPCSTTFIQSRGWRNPLQVTRFLWDLVDSTTDSGQDDANYGVTDIVAALESMPCSGNQGGVDGSCEEHAVPVFRPSGDPLGACSFATEPCTCENETDGETSPTGTGTRDSYNVFDIAEILPGGEGSERTLNCVQGAPD